MQLLKPKISEKTISEYFGNGVSVFFQEKYHIVRAQWVIKKIGVSTTNLGLMKARVLNKIFGVGIFETLLAAKIEGNFIGRYLSFY